MYQLDMDRVVETIIQSNNRNIALFRYAVCALYDIGNAQEVFAEDCENVKKLVRNIEEMNVKPFDILKRKNVKMLLEVLKEKYLGEI